MKKKLSIVLLALLAFVILTGCGRSSSGQQGSAGVFTARAATGNSPPHPNVLGLEKLAELLDERSGGRIKVDVFHSGQLGQERDMIEGMMLDTLQFMFVTSAPLSGFTDAYNVFDLPFLFEDIAEARRFCDSDFGLQILASLESDGIIGLGFGENGMRHVTNSRRPITRPEDLRGIKIRTMENPIHMEAFRVMGADPTPMSFGELFTALQQGTVDAQENPFVVINSSRFYEVQEFLSLTEHLYSPCPLLMSRPFYESLPADLQRIVREVGLEAKDYQRAVNDEQTAQLLAYFDGVINVNFVEKAPFMAATRPIYDRYIGNLIPQSAYDAVRRVLGR